MRLLGAVLLAGTTLLIADRGPASGAEATAAQEEFFEKKVRPILVERCYDCHRGDAPESGLRVDTLSGLLQGGTRGPAIVPGDPQGSLLIRAVKHSGQIFMPPREKIPQREIDALAAWVESGAPWPGAAPVTVATDPIASEPLFTDEQRNFWAFQPPAPSDPPAVSDPAWVKTPIDAFILARLDAAGLSPAPPADKRTLIRRVTFDLIGLPPTPKEVDAFLADESAEAFSTLIERLLASPQYGVRWARHWLDIARYADSNGLDENLAYANAYRYRDYVVAAFNEDKPYDRFVQEQIAGDLLPYDGVDQRLDAITATGFLSIGAKMLAEDDPAKMQMDIVDEQVDTVGRAFLGLTLGCARCHDHKFDPIPTSDYYSLAGIFKSTKTMDSFSVVARWHERPLASVTEIERQHQQQLAIDEAKRAIDEIVAAENEKIQQETREHLADYLLAAETARQREMAIQQAKPIGNDSALSERDDVLIIEAEQFSSGNVRTDFEGYGKGIGVILNDGELPNSASYRFAIDEPGLYQLELRYAAAESRPCRVRIDKQFVTTDAASRTTGSWNPDTQTWFVELAHEFDLGYHNILLLRNGPFPHFDKLLIAPVSQDQQALFSGALAAAKWDREVVRPRIVKQWKQYLERTADDPASPFAVWHAFATGQPLSLPTSVNDPLRSKLLGDPQPQSLAELAGRYQQLFAEAGGPDEPSSELRTLRETLDDPRGPFAVPDDVESLYSPAVAADLAQRREKMTRLEEAKISLPMAMSVAEGTPEDIPIHIRGSHLTLGDVAPRRFPRILSDEPDVQIGDDVSGRLQLARWMTEPDHPLTSRVMVNRLWQWHFGEGLVRSPDNFGRLGERPTHPELLDWLAVQFVESGWSVKDMHRLIMRSSTYQMSTAYDADAASQDPENRLWQRRNRRRLEAEAIRDAILAVAGNLDLAMGGSLLPTKNRQYVTSTANVDPVVYASTRRSLYLPVVRSAVYDVFQAFDFADPSVLSGKRMLTTVAPQALFMMNSGLVAEHTYVMAEQLLGDTSDTDAARVESFYLKALSRPAAPDETARALDYVARTAASLESRGRRPDEANLLAWQSLCRAVIASNEFVYVE